MTQTDQKNVPKLRFSGFEGVWEETTIGGLGAVVTGSTPDTSVNSYYGGDFPFYSPSDIPQSGGQIFLSEKTLSEDGAKKTRRLPAESTLFVCIGSTIGKVGITTRGSATNQQINAVVPNENNDAQFVHLALVKAAPRIRKITAVQAVPIINKSTFEKEKVRRPALPEQRKIASFLGAVDTKIVQLAEKKCLLENYKKGCMQQLFSQKIRFKDDDGNDFPNWEEKRLGEVLTYEQPTKYLVVSSEYSDAYKTPVLTAGKTFILGYTDETQGIFNRIPTIIFDDFTTAFKFVDFPFKAKSSAMKMLSLHNKADDIRFVYGAMLQVDFQVGEHKRYWISEYQNEFIPVPHPDEQRKIANFLSALDRKIELVGQELEHAKTFKKALLQQMFV